MSFATAALLGFLGVGVAILGLSKLRHTAKVNKRSKQIADVAGRVSAIGWAGIEQYLQRSGRPNVERIG